MNKTYNTNKANTTNSEGGALVATSAGALCAPSITEALSARFVAYIDARPKTVETYTRALRQFFKWMRAEGIASPSRLDVLKYRETMRATRKPATVQNYIIALRQFFKWTDQEGIYKNIADNVKGAKLDKEHKKDALTTAQIRDILNSTREHTEACVRDYAIIALMITGGLRTVEIARANLDDLRTVGDNAVLFIQGKGRDEKTEYVKLAQPVEKAIRDYLSFRGNAEPRAALFTSTSNNNQGERLTPRSISGIVKAAMKRAGYNSDRLTAHSLRHTAGTLNLLNGGTLEETQQLLRHSNINTTMIYLHHLDRAANQSEARIAGVIF